MKKCLVLILVLLATLSIAQTSKGKIEFLLNNKPISVTKEAIRVNNNDIISIRVFPNDTNHLNSVTDSVIVKGWVRERTQNQQVQQRSTFSMPTFPSSFSVETKIGSVVQNGYLEFIFTVSQVTYAEGKYFYVSLPSQYSILNGYKKEIKMYLIQ